MVNARVVWIDLETGGTDCVAHGITQIAAIATKGVPPNDDLCGEPFERKVQLRDGMWTQEALDTQGYTEERWADAIPIGQALHQLAFWCKAFTHVRESKRTGKPYRVANMAGHNVEFDGDFIRAECDRLNLWMPLTNWTGGRLDTLQLAKWFSFYSGIPTDSYKLEDLCAQYKLPEFESHDALGDIMATWRLAQAILGKLEEGW